MQLEAEPILDAPSRFGETAFRPKCFRMAPMASMLIRFRPLVVFWTVQKVSKCQLCPLAADRPYQLVLRRLRPSNLGQFRSFRANIG